jgi:hypothetical protein
MQLGIYGNGYFKANVFIFTLIMLMTLLSIVDFELAETSFVIGCFFISVVLMSISVSRIFKNKINANVMALAGFSGFGFLDIVKHTIYDSGSKIINQNVYLYTVYLVFISFVVYVVFYVTTHRNHIDTNCFVDIKYEYYYKIALPIAIFSLLFYVFFSGTYLGSYLLLFSYVVKSFCILSFYLYFKTKSKLILFVSLFFLVVTLDESSRRAYVSIFVPMVVIYVDSLLRNIKYGLVFNKLKIVVIFLIMFIFLNYLRADNDFGANFKIDDKMSNTIEYIVTLKSIDTFYNSSFIVDMFPEKFDYYLGETYLSVFVAIIPRFLWPDKPVGLGAPLGLMQRTGQQEFVFNDWYAINQFSLSPGFVGEAYANFGTIGVVILSALLGFFAKFIDCRFFNNPSGLSLQDVSILPIVTSFFLIGRGDFYSAMNFSIFLFIFLRLFILIVAKKNIDHGVVA